MKLLFKSILPTAALTLTLVFNYGCGKAAAKSSDAKAARVETAELAKKTFLRKIRVQGTVQPVEEANISSKTSGTLDELLVDEGNKVTKGQLLFQVDRQNLENAVTVSRHNLQVSKEELATAEVNLKVAKTIHKKEVIDYNRAKRLHDSHAVSEDAFETADVNLQKAEADVEKSESIVNYSKARMEQQKVNLLIAEKNLEDSRVLAPFDGVVTSKVVEQGEFVNSGTPIIHIQNQEKLELSCLISGIYYESVIPEKTRILLSLDRKSEGDAILTYRAPSIDPVSRTFEIKVRLPAKTELISGTLCDVDLVLDEREGYGLPADSILLRKGGQYKAFIVKDGKAQIVGIEPGITEYGITEVKNPEKFLQEKFIVSGQYFVNSGDPVITIAAKEKAE